MTPEEARAILLEGLRPGEKVYTVLRHVSRSGMTRIIDPIRMTPDGPRTLAAPVAALLGLRLDRDRWGVKIEGCGMDMGFELVYLLGHHLFPDGFGCVGEHCPSSDHANGDRNFTPHGACDLCLETSHPPSKGHEIAHWHSEGGYALRQSWL